GATTREARDISPALRSRCAEIYFEPLTPAHIVRIVENAAKKLDAALADGVAELISDYTVEGRKAINLLADAYSFALERREAEGPTVIGKDDVYAVAQVSRLYQYVKDRSSERPEVGHVFGLGVAGYLGSVIEIEAVAFPAHEKGKGAVRFNETAGSMAKDSVFNAASVVRRLTGIELSDYDLHINVIGGGNIDGPSAGVAILSAITSALTDRPLRQDVAVTGEISLYGHVRPVGGVFEKAYGAKQAGMKTLVIPEENRKDIPEGHLGLSIHPVETAEEAFRLLFADGWTDTERKDADANG
ncbi:MAG: ATP-dependent protease, Lon family, partial [Schwartzia sp.]|nr:ATP-dependent protease, Lon family [Schwartzia sp. (in: firmicutes)]